MDDLPKTEWEYCRDTLKEIEAAIEAKDKKIRDLEMMNRKQKELLDRAYCSISFIEAQCFAAERDGYETIPVQSVKANLRRFESA